MDPLKPKKLVDKVCQEGRSRKGRFDSHSLPAVNKESIKAIRKQLQLSQTQFAYLINVNVRTLQNWEQGHRAPEGPAVTLLRVVIQDPQAVLKALHADEFINENKNNKKKK